MKNPAIEAAKLQRLRDRRAVALIRGYRGGQVPVVLDTATAERLVVLASSILADRCAQTGEDPAAVLDAMEAAI